MLGTIRAALLALAAALLLSGCLGWMAHPMYDGGHHHRWEDADGRPFGPGYRCTDGEWSNDPSQPPCPYRR